MSHFRQNDTIQNRVKFFTLLSISTLAVVVFIYYNIIASIDIFPTQVQQKQAQKQDQSLQSRILDFLSSETEKEPVKKLFCLIKTTPDSLKSNKTLTVYNIWASRCSNHRFITIIPEELRSATFNYGGHREIQMPFFLLHPEGLEVESYPKITTKLYSALRYVFSRFADYDWYLISDDDAYINMDHMDAFLASKNSSSPVTYGHNFKISVQGGFHSGGCGYVLTGESFRRVGNVLTSNPTFCGNTGIDDVDLASCLRLLGVNMSSSLDQLGRERFIPVNFMSMYLGPMPDWLDSYSSNKPKQGVDCCSDTIIGIHYMAPKQQILLDTAFKTVRFETEMFNKRTGLNISVTFKSVIDNYLLLINQTKGYLT